MLEALMVSEPERWGIMKKSLKGKAAEFKQSLTGDS